MTYPLVSVYLPTYNRIDLLKRAVNSVLSQSYKNFELIIVDDGSSDGTLDYLSWLEESEKKVFVLHKKDFEKKKGAPASRNLAIENSRGKFITGLDDDDYFHKQRIEAFLKSYSPKFSCLSSNFYKMTKKGVFKNSYIGRKVSCYDLFDGNFLGSQVFVEKERIIDAGLFDEHLRASQDLDMWIRLTQMYGDALRVRDYLYYVDVSHESERISKSSSRAVGTMQFLEKHHKNMSPSQILYKTDSVGDVPINNMSKILRIKRYSPRITLNIIRGKLKLA